MTPSTSWAYRSDGEAPSASTDQDRSGRHGGCAIHRRCRPPPAHGGATREGKHVKDKHPAVWVLALVAVGLIATSRALRPEGWGYLIAGIVVALLAAGVDRATSS